MSRVWLNRSIKAIDRRSKTLFFGDAGQKVMKCRIDVHPLTAADDIVFLFTEVLL